MSARRHDSGDLLGGQVRDFHNLCTVDGNFTAWPALGASVTTALEPDHVLLGVFTASAKKAGRLNSSRA
jgi:hypothetical protein